MGAKLYGGTTIGPHGTAGGEIKNAILSGYSNKAHDGYLGDAVIGEWCNLGAGTTNSNVKNTAGVVKMWSEAVQAFVPVGKKAGLIMGDYSRSAINTGFNTGTVVGACSNVFGDSQPPKHVLSFTWGSGLYQFEKALADIDRWKQFKGEKLTEREKEILETLYPKSEA
jgi:UDP-N-acetylglucosamine diphosphorylase / glucose-1-phosphate thymidylyltransferase / UDP-N-acetylgalactosamine diphosphorylase / glucosamine-1-phosphate N-acetyltransferase / galactosamine-1-phosphate N-acetyltransferase